MPNVLTEAPPVETIADLLERLGDIPPERVRFRPFPGTATEKDVLALSEAADKRLCELIDGTLVEKAMGLHESQLAGRLIYRLMAFIDPLDLGVIAGEGGTIRLEPGQVRIPDVAFISWDRLPGGRLPKEPIPDLAPDLAVEVLSKSNTKKEMTRKLSDYFNNGVRLVWYVDPQARTVRVYTGIDQSVLLHETDTLDGGAVLPGFQLPLAELFRTTRRDQEILMPNVLTKTPLLESIADLLKSLGDIPPERVRFRSESAVLSTSTARSGGGSTARLMDALPAILAAWSRK